MKFHSQKQISTSLNPNKPNPFLSPAYLFTILISNNRSSSSSGIRTQTNTFFFSWISTTEFESYDGCTCRCGCRGRMKWNKTKMSIEKMVLASIQRGSACTYDALRRTTRNQSAGRTSNLLLTLKSTSQTIIQELISPMIGEIKPDIRRKSWWWGCCCCHDERKMKWYAMMMVVISNPILYCCYWCCGLSKRRIKSSTPRQLTKMENRGMFRLIRGMA